MDFNINSLVTPGLWAGAFVAFLILLRVANIFRYISNNQVGIVEKMWAAKGSIQSGFIALHGEAGFEPEILRGGVHVFFPFTYRIHKSDLVTVGQGKIAYVFARDGTSLGLPRHSRPTTPRTSPTFRMFGDFSWAAARKVRSARFCAREPMRSTPRNLPSSPMSGSMATP
jgi:hypothetical protein